MEHVFEDVLELHGQSVASALDKEKEYISERPPSLKISYKDGTEYVLHDQPTLQNVIPGRGRSIKSIEISSRFGNPTCSIELHAFGWRDYANLIVAGLEDKASHFADDVISKLSRESDVTVFARKIWAPGWAFFFSAAFWGLLGRSSVHDWQTAYGLGILIFITGMILSIPIEIFRARWLPPVAFLWGEDGRRAKQARIVVTTTLATVPLGIVINVISTVFVK